MGEERLRGSGDVRRDGEVVLRAPGPQTPAVLALLRYLEEVGYPGSPRPVGKGIAADGREIVTFIPGSSPHPRAWDDDALPTIGALLGDLHRAAAGFVPPPEAVWKPRFVRDLPGDEPVIGHCDTGPWNIVARGGMPVALIDWEFAGPVDAMWELAQAVWLNAQLYDDDIAERQGLPGVSRRAAQARLLVDGYGLDRRRRADLVDKVIAVAVHAARAEAIDAAVTPESSQAVDNGYPVLWAISWRVRSASWMLQHRPVLERALS